MARDVKTIRIESVLGGHSPTTHFAAEDQFRASIGIDPSVAIRSTAQGFDLQASIPSGLLRPMSVVGVGTTAGYPVWIEATPKRESTIYVYDVVGSVYTVDDTFSAVTGLGDLNDGGTSKGNGMAYYDNYMYFARDTTIARYGPLNGTASFTDDYWAGTLGLAPLTDTNYHFSFYFGEIYPNHVMHRHSDGRLYIADVVDNQGTIHFIQTTKTTVEGDTNDGSTYNKVQVGYGLHPAAIESYGNNLVIAFNELTQAAGARSVKSARAKIAFWDTISDNISQITWVEFPDSMITGIKNLNGTLYIFSANQYTWGFRVMRYIGGSSFEEVATIPTGDPPLPGAIETESRRTLFGSFLEAPFSSEQGTVGNSPCVYSYGLNGIREGGLFNTIPVRGYDSDGNLTEDGVNVTALRQVGTLRYGLQEVTSLIGYGVRLGSRNGLVVADPSINSGTYANAPSAWWSQTYRIGQPFKITKIRIPLANKLTANLGVTPTIYTDSGEKVTALTAITSANFGTTNQAIVIRPENLTGYNDFFLELAWTGSELLVVGLPITIEYELIDD
jgi:hypothetical protein